MDNDCILQEVTHFGKETISRADDLTVPVHTDEFNPPEGDELISRDNHSSNNQESPSRSFHLNLEDNMLNDEEKI